ncbi:hypothetical protein Y032_0009g621 [Ancylostoma ceylanicum]|nr:hypothetical protein Y032_0009g621 [Ancylostoma ceylanicum]
MYCQIIHDNYLPFASKVYGLNCRLAQDNDPKHKSRYTTEMLDMWNVHRIDWPPESPDLNPIELVWHQLKYYLRHTHKPHSKEELEAGILKFWGTKMTRTQCQADQLDEQSLDFPLSYAALNSCTHVPPSEAEDYSDTLQPSSIAVYADMGHLTTYCTSSHSTLQAGILDSCELVVDGSSIAG